MSKFLLDDVTSFLSQTINQLEEFESNFNYKYGDAAYEITFYIKQAQVELFNIVKNMQEHKNNIEEDFYNSLED
ncbi:MAG: hypothetical protein WBF90_11815 [Rivularia sp. (in: cyanobacteria)]